MGDAECGKSFPPGVYFRFAGVAGVVLKNSQARERGSIKQRLLNGRERKVLSWSARSVRQRERAGNHVFHGGGQKTHRAQKKGIMIV